MMLYWRLEMNMSKSEINTSVIGDEDISVGVGKFIGM